jgi:nitrate reductase NapE
VAVSEQTQDRTHDPLRRRRMEIFAFLFLTVFLIPALAVATVGGYGLAVWVYQMIAGPPGPPAPPAS